MHAAFLHCISTWIKAPASELVNIYSKQNSLSKIEDKFNKVGDSAIAFYAVAIADITNWLLSHV